MSDEHTRLSAALEGRYRVERELDGERAQTHNYDKPQTLGTNHHE